MGVPARHQHGGARGAARAERWHGGRPRSSDGEVIGGKTRQSPPSEQSREVRLANPLGTLLVRVKRAVASIGPGRIAQPGTSPQCAASGGHRHTSQCQ